MRFSILLLGASACFDRAPAGPAPCQSCHGTAENAAPPKALGGRTELEHVGVGAHQVHLSGPRLGRPVACDECHVVPAEIGAPGHVDTPWPAEIAWGRISKTGGVVPRWDRASGTCASIYCHGGSLTGGAVTAPLWTQVDGSGSACGACHGVPPPPPHPASAACEMCHAPVAGPDLSLLDPSRHVDARLDVIEGTCASACHGTFESEAPPPDLSGNSDTSSVTVGAHRSHLDGGVSSRAVACTECHVNPVSVGDPGHTDTPAPAEVVFGRTASISASPIWDRSAARCSDTYCHGGASPVWTDVGGGQAACGTCHGLPPPSPHPTASACEQCHGQTAGAGMTIAIRDNHVDGIVQLDVNPCLGCHGDTESLAPPPDTMGRTDVSLRTVGAHEAHVIGGTNAKVVECSACHVVPSMTTDPGHLDGAPADVTFSGLALDDSAAPSWDGALLTCSGTYCHGGTMIGGANVDPVWTTVDGSQVACGSCHAIPPPAPHPASMACENCHGPGGASLTIDDPTRHIDGTVDF